MYKWFFGRQRCLHAGCCVFNPNPHDYYCFEAFIWKFSNFRSKTLVMAVNFSILSLNVNIRVIGHFC